ncbi:MAG: hypothetical protein MMC23_009589 [Stictis urceolatum]|nr:hypothetical protein [Stictis urceolata]
MSRIGPANAPPLSPGEPNRTYGIIAWAIITPALDALVVSLRFVVRKRIVKSISWDDWTILAAVLISSRTGNFIGGALVIVEVHYGFGRHKQDLTPRDYREFERFSYGEWIQTFATMMFTKVSICLFLLRIVIGRTFIRSLQAAIAILVLSNIALTLMWILQCRPADDAWMQPQKPGFCFGKETLKGIILAQASQ